MLGSDSPVFWLAMFAVATFAALFAAVTQDVAVGVLSLVCMAGAGSEADRCRDDHSRPMP